MKQCNCAAQAGQGNRLNRTDHQREQRNHHKRPAEPRISRHAGGKERHEHAGKQHRIDHFEKHNDTRVSQTLWCNTS